MKVGIVKEIKNNENRVAIIPSTVKEFIRHGHEVYIECGAGLGSGFRDEEYAAAGAVMVEKAEDVWNNIDLLYKVKEILPSEYKYIREDMIVMTYLHSNAHRDETQVLLDAKCPSIALEDITSDDPAKKFPLVANMGELAGKGGFLAACYYAQSVHGGPGLILNNVCGSDAPIVSIIGCGYTGMGAAELASSFGCTVKMMDIDLKAMERAKDKLPSNVSFLYSSRQAIEDCLKVSDVVINCVLWPKTRKDHLINKEDLAMMKHGAMIIDVACDDGGAVETCRSTTHDDPVYYVDGILHYAVDNIPSAFSKSSSTRFANDSLPYVLAVADKGIKQALKDDKHLRAGLTTFDGKMTLKETAEKFELPWADPEELIKEW